MFTYEYLEPTIYRIGDQVEVIMDFAFEGVSFGVGQRYTVIGFKVLTSGDPGFILDTSKYKKSPLTSWVVPARPDIFKPIPKTETTFASTSIPPNKDMGFTTACGLACDDISRKLRNSKLSKSERKLRKSGLKTDQGWTRRAYDVFLEELLDQEKNRKLMVEKAEIILADEDEDEEDGE